jgi:hypothetical protein
MLPVRRSVIFFVTGYSSGLLSRAICYSHGNTVPSFLGSMASRLPLSSKSTLWSTKTMKLLWLRWMHEDARSVVQEGMTKLLVIRLLLIWSFCCSFLSAKLAGWYRVYTNYIPIVVCCQATAPVFINYSFIAAFSLLQKFELTFIYYLYLLEYLTKFIFLLYIYILLLYILLLLLFIYIYIKALHHAWREMSVSTSPLIY